MGKTGCVDFYNDSLIDLIVGGNGVIAHYVQNAIGSSSFSIVPGTFNGISLSGHISPSITDLDNDGLWDLLIGNQYNIVHYEQLNNTSLTFILQTYNWEGIGGYSGITPYFEDVNGDGTDDLLYGENSGGFHLLIRNTYQLQN